MTDESIIRLYFDRDQQAIAETDLKYGPVCTRVARNILLDLRDAEESVNDTWLAAWNTIPPQHPHPLRTYLLKILRNLATAQYHHNTAQKRNSYYDVALEELEDCLSSGDGVEDHLTAQALTEELDRFLSQLDRENRVLFVRRYWYGDSVSSLAQELAMGPNAVSARLSRLRHKLGKQLKKEGYLT